MTFSLSKLQLRTPSKITMTIVTLSIENLKNDNKHNYTQNKDQHKKLQLRILSKMTMRRATLSILAHTRMMTTISI
jgi:hypothetical protein